ncbi:unnamed protein product [Penicillium olsonii]|nr:unnamed protein product [Penicillium olsonii]
MKTPIATEVLKQLRSHNFNFSTSRPLTFRLFPRLFDLSIFQSFQKPHDHKPRSNFIFLSTMEPRGRFINWGACREGAMSTLPRFASLGERATGLILAYQTVLDRDETFTQYYSEERLESYNIEASLREEFGVGPACLNDPGNPSPQRDFIISWATIFRDGVFEKKAEDRYLCRVQGRIVEIDESIHRTIMISRRAFPPAAQAWPIPADVEREYQLNLSIENDVSSELNDQIKYVERMRRLQLALRRRRKNLQELRDSVRVKTEPKSPEPSHAGYRTPSVSQLLQSIESRPVRERDPSYPSESSTVSTGDDIPYGNPRNEPTPGMQERSLRSADQGVQSEPKDPKQIDRAQQAPAALRHKARGTINTNDETRSAPSTPPTTSNLPTGPADTTASSSRPVQSSAFMPINRRQAKAAANFATPTESPHPKRLRETRQAEQTVEPSPKRRKSSYPNASAELDSMTYGQHLAMWNDQSQQSPSTQKPPKDTKPEKTGKKKRERNNFTEYEKEHAPSWIRAQLTAGVSGVDLERAYMAQFGTKHHSTTLKAFLDRNEAKAKALAKATGTTVSTPSTQEDRQPSKIVVLKEPEAESTPNNDAPVNAEKVTSPPPPSHGHPAPAGQSAGQGGEAFALPFVGQSGTRASEPLRSPSVGYREVIRAQSVALTGHGMENGLPGA